MIDMQFFLLRRSIFVIIVLFMSENFIAQILILQGMTLATIYVALSLKLFDSNLLMFIAICNESTIMLSNYFMLLFFDAMPSSQEQYKLGFIYMGIIFLNIIIQFIVMSVSSVLNMK